MGECKLENKYYRDALDCTNLSDAKTSSLHVTIEHMHVIANYYMINGLSCQQLMVKHNMFNEYREISSIAFLSLFNTHYFSGEMKVQNLLSASTWQQGILTSMISHKQTEKMDKYPRAYVFRT